MLLLDQLKKGDPQLRLLTTVVTTGLLVLLAGLWWVQVVRANYYQSHLEAQSLRTVRVPAVRGKILDRNGNVLAENRPNYSIDLYLEDLRRQFHQEYERICPVRIVTNAAAFWKRPFVSSTISTQRVRLNSRHSAPLERQARFNVASNIVAKISRGLGESIAIESGAFDRHYTNATAMPFTVLDNLNATNIARFEEYLAGNVSADLEIQAMRVYPHGTTAAHVLGYVRQDDRSVKGEEAYFSYRLPDFRGVVGVEGYFDRALRGRAGVKSVLVNNLGYRKSESMWAEAQPGSNIVLTLDLRIQEAAERSLARHVIAPKNAGAVVVMDVHTGDVLALVSLPSYDPNLFARGISKEDNAVLNDPVTRPQINRATQENYPPGSIFKPVVGLACLEAGMDPKMEIYNPGYIYVDRRRNDLAPPGEYDFHRALLKSSNTYFITNGLRFAGIQNIIKLGERLHLGERFKFDGLDWHWPTWQETAGNFPSLKRVKAGWSDGDTANICIGQGELDVTPLQMAVLASALANGGKVLLPRLIERFESQDPLSNDVTFESQTARVRDELGVHAKNLRILQEAMLADTEDSEGTAYRAFRYYYRNAGVMRVCGKTGTAEIQNPSGITTDQITWFLSFAPYEKPKYAVVVMIESGGSGGGTCAPVAADIYTAIQKLENTDRTQSLVRTE